MLRPRTTTPDAAWRIGSGCHSRIAMGWTGTTQVLASAPVTDGLVALRMMESAFLDPAVTTGLRRKKRLIHRTAFRLRGWSLEILRFVCRPQKPYKQSE